MKTINIISLIIVVLGLLVSIIGWLPAWGLGTGYIAVFIGYPLIIISIILFIIGFFIKSRRKK